MSFFLSEFESLDWCWTFSLAPDDQYDQIYDDQFHQNNDDRYDQNYDNDFIPFCSFKSPCSENLEFNKSAQCSITKLHLKNKFISGTESFL